MARPARGEQVLEQAHEAIAQARTLKQLRQAQALVLPLKYGLSLQETAQAIGHSVGWTCRLRNQFLAGDRVDSDQRPTAGGRRRQHMSPEQEQQALAPFLERARNGGILVVSQIKSELEAKLSKSIALSTVYKLLHRNGWRKLAPDKRHPQSDAKAQEDWKKNFPNSSPR